MKNLIRFKNKWKASAGYMVLDNKFSLKEAGNKYLLEIVKSKKLNMTLRLKLSLLVVFSIGATVTAAGYLGYRNSQIEIEKCFTS